MKSNNGILTEKEIQARTKFWNKKQFRIWGKKELERTSKDMQNLLVAIKGLNADEIKAIRNLHSYAFETCRKDDPLFIVWAADRRDLDYAISIAPKTFRVKQG